MGSQTVQRSGGGFALAGLLVGLAAGFAGYGIIEFWGDRAADETAPATAFLFVLCAAAATLLLAERGALVKGAPAALVIAGVLAAPNYFMLRAANDPAGVDQFAVLFWFLIGGPLAAFLMTTLAKAAIHGRTPPAYASVFFHGLTLPLIFKGAGLFTLLSLLLLYAWAALLRTLDVDFFHKLFQEPWFILPFAGAIGGLSIAMMRSLDAALGALRFVLLLFCRIAMPITAVFSVTFLAVLLAKGPEAIFAQAYPGGIMLGLAFAGMLIFNGVYQNGEGGPPPAWLRFATIIALAAFPVYAGLAAWAFLLRVGEYGLTPARIIGLAMNGLAAGYSLACLGGLLSELNWGGKRWMPLVAPLNTLMALIWIVVLIALATPLADPWSMSARSQEQVLLSGKTTAAEFDFRYLKSRLGAAGERALERLAATPDSHPEAAAIRARARETMAATAREAIEAEEALGEAPEASPASAQPGLEELEFNPEGAAPPESEPNG